jgi:outer membrane protein assembly factor BamB
MSLIVAMAALGAIQGLKLPVSAAAAPSITGLSTMSAPPSGCVTITGHGFGNLPALGRVEIGSSPAFKTRWSDTAITAYVPGRAPVGSASVRVVTAGGMSNTVGFAVDRMPSAQIEHVAWRFRMDSPYVLHRQAIAPDGTVYVQDVYGFLYALDHDGALQWIYNAGSYPNGGGGEGPVVRHPDGTIIVTGNPLGPDSQIHAVNPDATRRWVFTDTNTQGVIAGPAVGPDGNIYFATELNGRGLVCLSPSGDLLWSNAGNPAFNENGQLGEEITFGPAGGAATATQLYVAFDERGMGTGDLLFGFTLAGNQRFATPTGLQGEPLGQRQGQPAVGIDGTIYLCALVSNQGWRLQAFEPASGARAWTHFGIGTNLLTEPDVGPDGTIYVGRNLAELHAVLPNATERWVYTDPGILFAPIASPTNDVILVGGRITYGAPGFVKAVSADTGALLWTIDLPAEGGFNMIPFSRPTFAADGRRATITTTLPGQPSGEEYCYLYALDLDVSTGVPVAGVSAAEFDLVARPNPFRGATQVEFQNPSARPVTVRVFDPMGRLVREVFSGIAGNGGRRLTWDGRDGRGRDAARGTYFIEVTAEGRSASLKVVRTE